MPTYDFEKTLTYLDQLKCFLQHSVVGTEKGLTGVRSSGIHTLVDYSTTLSQEDYEILVSLVTNFEEQPPQFSDAALLVGPDGKQITKNNLRPIGTHGYCTSRGENPASPTSVGNGTEVI